MAKQKKESDLPEAKTITPEEAGAFLREKREAKSLLQSKVAELVGLPNINQMTFYERGKIDVRRSKYLPKFVSLYGITAHEMRERMGLDILIGLESPLNESLEPHVTGQKPEMGVLLPDLGTIQAGTPNNGIEQVRRSKRMVRCPLESATKYPDDELYVLTVNGDSMVSQDVRQSIPPGAHILVRAVSTPKRTLEVKPKQIIVAWIPELGSDGVGVLKRFGRGKTDQVVLESYNPTGPRFPAQSYPRMKAQGVVLGYWVDFGEGGLE